MFSLSFVSASGNDTADFQELNNEINQANDTVMLTKDYICNEEELNVTNNITIDGNNHSFLANDSQSILKVNISNSSIIILKNINFNIPIQFVSNSSNITLINCNFNVTTQNNIEWYMGDNFEKSGSISGIILKKAKSIVGKYKDLRAIKQLAWWVGRNIAHETNEGFYQSPEDTLKRTKGNCCSQTLLFLQMCESLGLLEKHKVYFVHVGQEVFGKRHFFVVIDHLCVDVDSYPYSPWGHAAFRGRGVFAITEYPTLPLKKNY